MDKKEIINKHIDNGVNIVDPNNTYIEENVIIEEGTIIYPNVSIRGNSKIGKNNIIDMNTLIIDSIIGNDNHIANSVITASKVKDKNNIGPFTNIRLNTCIGSRNTIGSFVELKNASIMDDNHIKHLAYCGDIEIKSQVNIGAGVVIANYDTRKKIKQTSKIENRVSLGSNSVLVSPVHIKENSQVAAGTVITKDIPKDSLVIARCREVIKENYYKGE